MRRMIITSLAALVAASGFASDAGNEIGASQPDPSPAGRIVASVEDPALIDLLVEVLERNPEIAALEAQAAAAGERRTAARKLPDPKAELTAFLLPPETRVGPQRFAARISQQLPGGGKLDKSSRAQDLERLAISAEVEALRLELVTRARRLAVELAYLDEARQVLTDDHTTLSHFEELARARYASGAGLQMESVQLQAEMTRLDARRTEIDERRAGVAADINRLRDRPGAPVPSFAIAAAAPEDLDWDSLAALAIQARPELAADEARIDRASVMAELAADGRTPDFTVGLTYAYVDKRTDADVPKNGQDVLGISGGISIPLWSKGTDAEVEAATQTRLAREASRRATVATVERELYDLRGRLPEIVRRLDLLEDVLPIQAEQSFASAEAAYAAGRVDALAMLDAERVLLDVRLAAARARADLAIALIDLEMAVAAPLPQGGSS